MFTYVVQYMKKTLCFVFLHALIQFLFKFKCFFVFQNIIFKINMITHLTHQWLFYTHSYGIGGPVLIYKIKWWHQTTETATIQWILTIFKHWGLTVKLHFLRTFWIYDWNSKHLKFIFIFCFVMPLIDFPIKIRFMWAKTFFQSNQNKDQSNIGIF